jgi:YbgC/YbaW family acyl-CoA thioester hydrolase
MARLKIDFPDEVLYGHDVEVRISDLNYGNHLGHDTLVSLLHEARARFFRHLGHEEWDTCGLSLMVVDLAVSYRAEVLFGQVLRIEVAVGEVGSRSCELLYRVCDRDSGTTVAVAKTGVVFVDGSTRKVVTLPAAFRSLVGRVGESD